MLKTAYPLKSIQIFIILLGIIFALSPIQSYAQDSNTKQSDTTPTANSSQPSSLSTNRPPDGLTASPPPVTDIISVDYGYLSSKEFVLTSALLIFFIIIIFLKFLLLWKSGNIKGKDILNNFELTMIIAATVIVIAAGFDSKQIAPALGLLGTIAGYLLGNVRSNAEGGGTNR